MTTTDEWLGTLVGAAQSWIRLMDQRGQTPAVKDFSVLKPSFS